LNAPVGGDDEDDKFKDPNIFVSLRFAAVMLLHPWNIDETMVDYHCPPGIVKSKTQLLKA
jgi:hypothetical protein